MSNPFSLKIKKVKREQKWERSCFFGACDIPTMFLHICEPDEFFFAQFNLLDIIIKMVMMKRLKQEWTLIIVFKLILIF